MIKGECAKWGGLGGTYRLDRMQSCEISGRGAVPVGVVGPVVACGCRREVAAR